MGLPIQAVDAFLCLLSALDCRLHLPFNGSKALESDPCTFAGLGSLARFPFLDALILGSSEQCAKRLIIQESEHMLGIEHQLTIRSLQLLRPQP
jgi:hypothetical protein